MLRFLPGKKQKRFSCHKTGWPNTTIRTCQETDSFRWHAGPFFSKDFCVAALPVRGWCSICRGAGHSLRLMAAALREQSKHELSREVDELWCVWFQLVWPADSRTAQFSPGCGSSPGVPESRQWWGDSYPAPAPAASHAHTCCCSDEESHHQWSVHSEISSMLAV